MPISIPVIEMIEIGAGGGSIAWVDAMGRIQSDPKAPARSPGPPATIAAARAPTVTDADLVLGKLDPRQFRWRRHQARPRGGRTGDCDATSASRLRSDDLRLPSAICEVVDENMANAARVHAVENGKHISDCTMIAFGGAAPLHAARLCEKLGIDRSSSPRAPASARRSAS